MTILTRQDAISIEQEHQLEAGEIASDREMSQAERIYLGVPSNPMLCMHVDMFPGKTTLILYDVETVLEIMGIMSDASRSPNEEAVKEIKENWVATVMCRDQGQVAHIGERVAMTFTGYNLHTKQLWSCSVVPRAVRNVWQGASRKVLLIPELAFVPPEYPGGRSPGKYIARLGVEQVITVHSILFQKIESLSFCNPRGLAGFAVKPPPKE